MIRNIEKFVHKEYDLIIIGGGVFGAAAAWDASLRGFSVAIVDKGDFSSATSANHFKMVHGGIRYLQHGDIVRIRESSRERSALLRIAPHLVKPLPIAVPTYGEGMKGRAVIGAGMLVYDLLTLDRNRSLPGDRMIPHGRFISREHVLKLFPGIREEKLTGAAVVYDGQMYNPSRIVLSFVRSAVEKGANAANYVEVRGFLKDGDQIAGIQALDRISNRRFQIRGRCVLNAAGPWAHRLLKSGLNLHLAKRPAFSRDLAFVVNRSLPHGYGLAFSTQTKDSDSIVDRGGRHLFAVPWRSYTLIGVWHGFSTESPENIAVAPQEIEGFVSEVNQAYPGLRIRMDEINAINTGLTLFGEERRQSAQSMSFGKRSLLLDHEALHGIRGLVTLIGVRATTARGMASKAIDLAARKLGKGGPRPHTERIPIYGGDIDSFDQAVAALRSQYGSYVSLSQAQHLVANYGSRWPVVMNYLGPDTEPVPGVASGIAWKAEIRHAVQEEMALHLTDALLRRTDAGAGRTPTIQEIEVCARIMAGELGWDKEKTIAETETAAKNPCMAAFPLN